MRRVLVTGGAGFIGCNFLRLMVPERPETGWVNLDALTYAGRPENTQDFAEADNYRFVRGGIQNPMLIEELFSEDGGFDVVNIRKRCPAMQQERLEGFLRRLLSLEAQVFEVHSGLETSGLDEVAPGATQSLLGIVGRTALRRHIPLRLRAGRTR